MALNLNKPDEGSVNWSGEVNDNFTDVENAVNALESHAGRHAIGGSDPLTSSMVVDAAVKRVQESGGPTTLVMGAVADGEVLKRSGSNVVGASTVAPDAHKDSHKFGGSDPFTSADLLEAVVMRLRESAGPTDLTLGAVADGNVLKRSGSNVVGASTVAPSAHKDTHKSGP
ncbi:hypothetical protein L6R52_42355, partial [Myxococcota bacterium]|nr:hypothetical protein [Myxococcota bacterium]